MLELEASGLSEMGPHRATNQDAIGCFAPGDPLALERKGYLYVVAVGIGVDTAGEVASTTAVAKLGEEYYSLSNHTRIEPALRQAVHAANLRIHELTHRQVRYRSMASTLTAIALAGSQAYVVHIGDARVYHWREGRLTQLTADHSEAAELVRTRMLKPEQVRDHPARRSLTRTLGSHPVPRPDYLRRQIAAGDQFVLCTAGLWSEIDDPAICEVLSKHPPQMAARTLVEAALARDCGDNVSVAVIRVVSVGAAPPQKGNGWLPTIFGQRSPA